MFKILELDDPEWVKRLNSLPAFKRDIHFYPQMFEPYVNSYGWAAKAALSIEDDDFVIQPILVTHDGQVRHAYNFGGPIGSAHVDTLSLRAHADTLSLRHEEDLCVWARETVQPSLTSYYVTLNPFLAEIQKTWCCAGDKVKDTVYIDLTDMKFRGTTRRLAEKAYKAGARVEYQTPTRDDLDVFQWIYSQTMDRAVAAPFWHVPKGFFENVFKSCPEAELHLVEIDDQTEAGCILIMPPPGGNGVAYYAWAGSLNTYPKMGINHLMVTAAADYAKSHGCTRLHLGGGLTSDPKDGLYLFKSGFSSLRAPVYTYKRGLA